MPQAWNIETGKNTITIGVIDSGIDSSHPEFAGRIDGNIFYDFRGAGIGLQKPLHTPNPTDLHGHGTWVSGILAMKGINAIGICWDIKQVSFKVFSNVNGIPQGSGRYVLLAINYAGAFAIPVLNFSGGSTKRTFNQSKTLKDYPGIFVCAAGNAGTNNDSKYFFPARHSDLPNVISVGGTKANNDAPATSSDLVEVMVQIMVTPK